MFLSASRVFMGSGISIIAWSGNIGDSHFSETVESIKRSEYSSSSMVIKGAFQMTEAPGDPSLWPLLVPGDMCNLRYPDFEVGRYTYSAMENNSIEFCCGTVSQAGGADYSFFESKPVTSETYDVIQGSILIAATGTLEVNGTIKKAPFILHAKNKSVQAKLNGRGMWLYRP